MGGIDKIDDPNVGLSSVLSMQATGILLQCAFPRHRHGQYQCIQWGMIEAFPDESPCREQDPRRVRWQFIDFGDEIRTLFFRHAPMQHEGFQVVFLQRAPDVFEVIGAFCQHQHLATVIDGALRLIGCVLGPQPGFGICPESRCPLVLALVGKGFAE